MNGRRFLHYWGLGDGCGCRGRLIMDRRRNVGWRRRRFIRVWLWRRGFIV
jgi:hypothetical protein